jgi:hypothetical protein
MMRQFLTSVVVSSVVPRVTVAGGALDASLSGGLLLGQSVNFLVSFDSHSCVFLSVSHDDGLSYSQVGSAVTGGTTVVHAVASFVPSDVAVSSDVGSTQFNTSVVASGALNITGNVIVVGDLTVSGVVGVHGSVNVTGNFLLNGTVVVSANSAVAVGGVVYIYPGSTLVVDASSLAFQSNSATLTLVGGYSNIFNNFSSVGVTGAPCASHASLSYGSTMSVTVVLDCSDAPQAGHSLSRDAIIGICVGTIVGAVAIVLLIVIVGKCIAHRQDAQTNTELRAAELDGLKSNKNDVQEL